VTDLVFVEETHQYFLGGVELPSVTTVIDAVLTDWSKIPGDTLEYTIVITNLTGFVPVAAIEITDEIPPNTTICVP